MQQDMRLKQQLAAWRDDLINLSRRNRLIYFPTSSPSALEIESPGAAIVLSRLETSSSRGWQFYLPPKEPKEGMASPPAREPRPDELVTQRQDEEAVLKVLRGLRRRATEEFMDRGLWVLYLGVGMLEWTDPADDEPAQSPLWLVPVDIRQANPREPFTLRRADEDPTINPALAVKLSSEFGIEVPTLEDIEDQSPDAILSMFRGLVSSRPDWRVTPRVVLATFSFHKEVMYRDLKDNEAQILDHPIVQALAMGANAEVDLNFDPIPEERLDQEAPPEQAVTIRAADASQRQCIAAARGGKSFVMDGPPGTGKSQTIANIIADLLALGRSILFVSEKAAALEVVQSRLEEAGLGNYVLALHSHKATRREVAQNLGQALRFHPPSTRVMAATRLQTLLHRRKELSGYAAAMNEVRAPLERSLHAVIGRVAELGTTSDAPPSRASANSLSAESLSRLIGASEALARAWGPIERGSDFLWRDLRESEYSASRVNAITRTIETAEGALVMLEREVAAAATELRIPWSRNLQDANRIGQIVALAAQRPADALTSWLTADSLSGVADRVEHLSRLAQEAATVSDELLSNVGISWRDLDGEASPMIDAALAEATGCQPPWEVADGLRRAELESLSSSASKAATLLEQLVVDAERLRVLLGSPSPSVTTKRARELAQLGLLAAEIAHPEGDWINPAVVAGVRSAQGVLSALVEEYQLKREGLSETFTDAILELSDLHDICVRFESVNKGLGRAKKQSRLDRKAVAACTRTGKASKAVIQQLRQALAWQELTNKLKAAEAQHAQVLGSYYRSSETDFGTLTAAIEVAERALDLAGRELDLATVRRQVALGGDPDPDLVALATAVLSGVEAWEDLAVSTWDQPTHEVLFSLTLAAARAWCDSVTRVLVQVRPALKQCDELSGRDLAVAESRAHLSHRLRLSQIEADIRTNREADLEQLGNSYNGLSTDWAAVHDAISWASAVREAWGGPLPSLVAERLFSTGSQPDAIAEAIASWDKGRDAITGYFMEPYATEIRADLDGSFADAAPMLAELKASTHDIDEWIAFTKAKDTLLAQGVEMALEHCTTHRVPATDLPGVIEKSVLQAWVDDVLATDGRLKHPRRVDRDAFVKEFAELDAELVATAASKVIEVCNERRPRTAIGAVAVIQREADKLRRHMPVRRLLDEAGAVAQGLKPCFMMSPLTVSQFLPPGLRFDAVIFDEASQVTPADSINCVYRGDQLIVAGDQKQLPPSSFWDRSTGGDDDEYEEGQLDEFQSVLDLAKGAGGLRSLPLRWHYRSQHEDLITFSNYSFYDGKLITFPGAVHDAPDLGVALFHGDGVYRRGGPNDNPREAERVVERILFHARNNPSLTLGVVAFSESQAGAIETALERERKRAPDLDSYFGEDRLNGFFVKNLETVQGDERDIIIFSVGYGRDEAGKFTLQFGPINKAGGKRRLNVAVTRARRRVEVVSSVTAGDFAAGSTNEGVLHFKRYLEFAERGVAALAIELSQEELDVESPFEDEVARAIRGWGFDAVPQVGVAKYRIDLGVRNPLRPGSFVLGVECDGVMYHSSKVARDRDRLRQEVLEGLGWQLHRIWGTAWYHDREGEEQRLKEAILAAVEGRPSPVHRPPDRRPVEEPELVEVEISQSPTWSQPYVPASPRAPRFQSDMGDPSAIPEIKRMIKEVVIAESPVHEEAVLRRIREAWGVGRTGHRIRDAFVAARNAVVRGGTVERDAGGFLWVQGQEYTVRTPDDDEETVRSIQAVCREERQLALKWLTQDAMRIARDELMTRAARLFGWTRLGAEISATLAEDIDDLVTDGVLGEVGGYVTCVQRPIE